MEQELEVVVTESANGLTLRSGDLIGFGSGLYEACMRLGWLRDCRRNKTEKGPD
jgi:hypothetical protein